MARGGTKKGLPHRPALQRLDQRCPVGQEQPPVRHQLDTNRLVVFTVTPTSWKRVATYSINRPLGLAVQLLPLPWQ